MSLRVSAALVLQCSTIVALGAGCGGPAEAPCASHDECESGFCRADGTCGPAGVDGPAAPDGPADGPAGVCAPDHDGAITLAELPLLAGRMATFRIAAGAAFDTAGVANGDGSRRWDLSAQLAGDADRVIALAPPAGTWWQASFPAASYAAPLAADSDLLGVFAVDAAAVSLLGVVSPEGGPTRTQLAYDPPAQILALPLDASSTWSSTSTVSGVALGVVSVYSERYAVRVDHLGTMTTPYGEFPVLRTATDLTRTSGLVTLHTQRTFAWIAECFGAVATVASQPFETSAEFDDPAEVRRLAP